LVRNVVCAMARLPSRFPSAAIATRRKRIWPRWRHLPYSLNKPEGGHSSERPPGTWRNSMNKKLLCELGSLVLVGALSQNVWAQSAPAAAPESAATRLAGGKIDKDQLNFNMESVGKLLESSSAARQIEASKAPEALARREKARELYKSARQALDAGDLNKASALLTEVRSSFFEAVRFAAPEEVTAKKQEADYRARLDSVNALLGAYKRVAGEK